MRKTMNAMRKQPMVKILAIASVLVAGANSGLAAPVNAVYSTGCKDNNTRVNPPAVGYASRVTRTFVAFSVADIVSAYSLSVADFDEVEFTFSFSTQGTQVTLEAGKSYVVQYIGFDTADPTTKYWPSVFYSPTVTSIDTGIEDTLADQTITASSFIMSDVTGLTAADYVTFRIYYNHTGSDLLQQLKDFQLTALLGGIELSSESVASNAAPGTLVGTLSMDGADDFDVLVTGSGTDSDDFEVTSATNLRTKVWMDAATKPISIVAYSNNTALATNDFTISVTAADEFYFIVSAEIGVAAPDDTVIGTAQTGQAGLTYSVVDGRTDLAYFDGAELKLRNSGDLGDIGTTNYIGIQAASATFTNRLVVAASVVSNSSGGTIFIFQ